MPDASRDNGQWQPPTLRERIREATIAHGVAKVARDLGISRSALGAYLNGTSRLGTEVLVNLRGPVVLASGEPRR